MYRTLSHGDFSVLRSRTHVTSSCTSTSATSYVRRTNRKQRSSQNGALIHTHPHVRRYVRSRVHHLPDELPPPLPSSVTNNDDDDDDDDDGNERALDTLARDLSTLSIVDYERPFESMARAYERDTRRALDARIPREALWYMVDPLEQARRSSEATGNVSGRERLIQLQATLDSFGLERSPNQRLFHRKMIEAIIPLLFKTDLDANIDSLLREFNSKAFNRELMIVTPRRW